MRTTKRLALSLVAFAALATPVLAGTDPFSFNTPSGWTELAKDKLDSPDAKQASPELLNMIRNGNAASYYFDFSQASSGFLPNINVLLQDGSGKITESDLDEAAQKLVTQFKAKKLEGKLITLSGTTAGRILIERSEGNFQIRQLMFVITGHKKVAFVTCTCLVDPTYEKVFESFLQQARGLEAPPTLFSGIGNAALIGAVIGGIVALLGVFKKKLA